VIVTAVGQEGANAAGAHVGEGDLLAGRFRHPPIEARAARAGKSFLNGFGHGPAGGYGGLRRVPCRATDQRGQHGPWKQSEIGRIVPCAVAKKTGFADWPSSNAGRNDKPHYRTGRGGGPSLVRAASSPLLASAASPCRRTSAARGNMAGHMESGLHAGLSVQVVGANAAMAALFQPVLLRRTKRAYRYLPQPTCIRVGNFFIGMVVMAGPPEVRKTCQGWTPKNGPPFRHPRHLPRKKTVTFSSRYRQSLVLSERAKQNQILNCNYGAIC